MASRKTPSLCVGCNLQVKYCVCKPRKQHNIATEESEGPDPAPLKRNPKKGSTRMNDSADEPMDDADEDGEPQTVSTKKKKKKKDKQNYEDMELESMEL